MKKPITLAAAIIIAAAFYAQNNVQLAGELRPLVKSPTTGLVTISQVQTHSALNQSEIFERCLMWLAYYNAPATYLHPQNGIIIAPITATFRTSFGLQEFHYTLLIESTDGKLRLTADHIYSDNTPANPQNGGWGFAEEWCDGYANGVKQPKGNAAYKLQIYADRCLEKIELHAAALSAFIDLPQTEF